MEWKKSSYNLSDFEKKQQLYINEAMQMAKKSVESIPKPVAAEEKITRKAEEKSYSDNDTDIFDNVVSIAADTEDTEEEIPENLDIAESQISDIEDEEIIQPDDYELTRFTVEEEAHESAEPCCEEADVSPEDDCISVEEQLRSFLNAKNPEREETEKPPDINGYINNYNKSRCNCAACQKKRQQNQ